MRRQPPNTRSEGQIRREAEAGRRHSNEAPPDFAPTPFRDTKASTNQGNDVEPVLCSICLCTFEPDSPTIELHCNHVYHKECLDEWLGVSTLCPLCKRVCEADEESKSDDQEEAFWRSWISRRRRGQRNGEISTERRPAQSREEAAVNNRSSFTAIDASRGYPRRNRRERWPPPPPPPPVLPGDVLTDVSPPNRLEQEDMVGQGLELIAQEGEFEEEKEWTESFERENYQNEGSDLEARIATNEADDLSTSSEEP